MQYFCERLVLERKRLKLTQDHVALEMSVSKRAYCNWEAGKTAPDVNQVGRLALLGFDIDFMMNGVRHGTVLSAEQEQQGYAVEILSREELALIDNFRNAEDNAKQAIKAASDALAQPQVKKA